MTDVQRITIFVSWGKRLNTTVVEGLYGYNNRNFFLNTTECIREYGSTPYVSMTIKGHKNANFQVPLAPSNLVRKSCRPYSV